MLPRDRILEGRDLTRSHREQLLPSIQVQREVGGFTRVVSLGTEPHENRCGNSPLLAENGKSVVCKFWAESYTLY